jgi:hypothetical protein
LASYDRSVNGALCPFLSLVPVHCGDLIGGSFPVLSWTARPRWRDS